jgi:uncharacterized repeat protein (TIGR01451 family)
VEGLESRQLLATITVNSAGDSNTRDAFLTFREALLVANGTLGVGSLSATEQAQVSGAVNSGTGSPADVIAFNIPGSGLKTIAPGTALPAITDPVDINGYSQPGTAVNTLPVGSNATLLIATRVPEIQSGNSTIRGLVITGGGLVLGGGSNLVVGNFIGVDASGNTAPGASTQTGIQISSNGNSVGGTTAAARNVISGNGLAGVHINGGQSNQILGNLIGTNAVGNAPLGNGVGVWISNGSNNSVGGSATGAGNVISGNANHGVRLAPEGVSDVVANNLLAGNIIGVSAAGSTAIGNGDGVFVNAGATTVGGTATGAGNVISGNPGGGLGIFNSTNTLVQGNRIGTSADGLTALGNGDVGLLVGGGTGTTVGGSATGARNVISGNEGHGISINTPGTGTVVSGNFIGVTANGVSPLGNKGSGVRVVNAGSGVTIGGATPNDGNIIYYNGVGGVVVDAGTGVLIRTNSIYGNSGLGIDLGGDGITSNDANDADTGPNNRQNWPVISLVTSDGTTTTIHGSLSSTANTNFALQFFSSAFADPTGFGEGQIYLGEATVTTNGSGLVNFIATVAAGAAGGQPITAVAIDPQGNTSEFSNVFPFAPDAAADLAVTVTTPSDTALAGNNVTFTVIVSNAGPNTAANASLVLGVTPGSTLVSVVSSQGTNSTLTGAIELALGSIASGNSATVTVVLSSALAGNLGVSALVYSAAIDAQQGNNTASKFVTVLAQPNIATTVSAPVQSAVNQNVTFVFTVTNPGQAAATQVVLTSDTLPAGTSFVSANASQGTVSQNGGVVTATLGTLAPGTSATVTIVLLANATGTLTFGATATLAENDPNLGDNRGSANVQVVTPADISVEVLAAPNPVFVNQPITYTIRVRNIGASDALGVQVQAGLTPGGTFISADPSQGSATPGSGSITASLGTIAPGGLATLTVIVTPSAAGAATLNASATALVDANGSNNAASATVTVNALPTAVYVQDIRALTNGGIRGYVLTFSGAVDPASASNPAAYRIISNGRNVPIRQIGYDVQTHAVTLATARQLPVNQFVFVGVHGIGPTAILAAPGTPIDGDNDGLPGGEFFVSVGRGRNLTYTDASGDLVNIRLSGLGAIELIRGPSGEARALLIYQGNPRRSILTGSVRRGRGGQGEGATRIPVALGLSTVSNRLPRNRFVIG